MTINSDVSVVHGCPYCHHGQLITKLISGLAFLQTFLEKVKLRFIWKTQIFEIDNLMPSDFLILDQIKYKNTVFPCGKKNLNVNFRLNFHPIL